MSKSSEIRKLKRELNALKSPKKESAPRESEEKKYEKEVAKLESERMAIEQRAKKASEGKGFLGRVWVGFKSNNQQAAIRSQIGEIRGLNRAKIQSQYYSEQAKALEQRNKLKELQAKSHISMDSLLGGSSAKKEYKAIDLKSLGI